MLGWVYDIFIQNGLSESTAQRLSLVVDFIVVLLIGLAVRYVLNIILVRIVHAYAKRTKTVWDDALIDTHVFERIVHFVPLLLLYGFSGEFSGIETYVVRITNVLIVLNLVYVMSAILNAGESIYRTYPVSRRRPIKGYIQIIQLLIWILGIIIAVATLLDKSPWLFVSGIGAMTAVLMLVFRDSILGFVAGVQLTTNDMVRIGDWIEMPKYDADGEITEITLNTVKVQNWDKTITMLPAYSLISDSFRNWRGMQDSGGRRIKRSIHIDVTSVGFCTEEMLDSYEDIGLIQEYVKTRRAEVASYNENGKIDTSVPINGRRMTNIGTFRAYIAAYLQNHPDINHAMTTMVRQLAPDTHGLPLEIYAFTNTTAWLRYEGIQSDIFDHIMAAAPIFGIRIHQYPSSQDIRSSQDVLASGALSGLESRKR